MKTLINLFFVLLCIGVAVGYYFKDDLSGLISKEDDVADETEATVSSTVRADLWERMLASCYVLQGEGCYDEAVVVARKAVGEAEKTLGRNHPGVASCFRALAYCYSGMERFNDANSALNRAIGIIENGDKSARQKLPGCLKDLGDNFILMQKPDEAYTVYQKAAKAIGSSSGHPDFADILSTMGHIHFEKKEYVKAESLYKKAVKAAEYPGSTGGMSSMLMLGHACMMNKKYKEAHSVLNLATKKSSESLDWDDPRMAQTLVSLSIVLESRNKHEKAATALERAIEIREELFDEDDPRLSDLRNRLAGIGKYLGE